jgi:hypothetical protein
LVSEQGADSIEQPLPRLHRCITDPIEDHVKITPGKAVPMNTAGLRGAGSLQHDVDFAAIGFRGGVLPLDRSDHARPGAQEFQAIAGLVRRGPNRGFEPTGSSPMLKCKPSAFGYRCPRRNV